MQRWATRVRVHKTDDKGSDSFLAEASLTKMRKHDFKVCAQQTILYNRFIVDSTLHTPVVQEIRDAIDVWGDLQHVLIFTERCNSTSFVVLNY